MGILLVTHDWGVIADISERVVVMYAGQVVERAEIGEIVHHPLHPYTQSLLASDPHNAPSAEILPSIAGTVPRPGDWPSGCHFHPRCNYATSECKQRPISLQTSHRRARNALHSLRAAASRLANVMASSPHHTTGSSCTP